MEEPTTKAELLQMMVNGRAALTALIEPIPLERMLESGVEATWSVKDILAHLTSWEVKMCAVLAGRQSELPPANWPTTADAVDAINADFTMANGAKSLIQVLQEFETAIHQALAAVEAMSEADLFDAARFEWQEGRPLWYLVADNTFAHYEEHIPSIEGWLAGW